MASSVQFVHAGILTALGAAVAVLNASTAAAHPGHGVTPDGNSAAHYLLEPLHGLGLVVGVLVAIACVGLVRSRRGRVTQD